MQRYAITDGAPRSQVEAWAHAGVEWIQVREPGVPPDALIVLAEDLATICRNARTGTCLLVNGLDAPAALRSGAAGVHLRGGATANRIQATRATGARVSVSCHSVADVQQARKGRADALLWAPVFGKTKDGHMVVPASGLETLAEACREAGALPVIALGGVTLQNAQECLSAGAAGVAGIRLFAGEQWRVL
jgi:thiamine-phosphate pyrophosphorylase